MNRQLIERLKVAGEFHMAGIVACFGDYPRNSYGPHYGMRSGRDSAIAEFEKGWDEAHAAAQACDRIVSS